MYNSHTLKSLLLTCLFTAWGLALLAQYQPAQASGEGDILFVKQTKSEQSICAMKPDGSNLRELYKSSSYLLYALSAPDKKQIAFVARVAFKGGTSPSFYTSSIYVMPASGKSAPKPVTHFNSATSLQAYSPTFSPDGKKIVFTGIVGRPEEKKYSCHLYVMNRDGIGLRQLTSIGFDNGARFDKTGKSIVFASGRARFENIYRMQADGSKQVQLTHGGRDFSPTISPDGKKIAFVSRRSGTYQIYIMNRDGSSQIRLTHSARGNFSPDFSHDGKRIVFSSNRDGNLQIYIMNSDGTKQTRLTRSEAADAYPRWD
jgi:TolB protein